MRDRERGISRGKEEGLLNHRGRQDRTVKPSSETNKTQNGGKRVKTQTDDD